MKVITSDSSILTMSSLEMVSYINSTRKPGEAELRHDHFMDKARKVLGEAAPAGMGTAFYYVNGAKRERQIYNFARREAILMAMSYSWELQAAVLDAWTSAEALLISVDIKPPVVSSLAYPDPDDHFQMVKAWVKEKELTLALTNEIKEAQPKIAFHDAVVADGTNYSLSDAAKILSFKPQAFNTLLRSEKYLMRDNVAYQYYVSLGVFTLRYSGYVLEDGSIAKPTTRITSKGIAYLQKKLAVTA